MVLKRKKKQKYVPKLQVNGLEPTALLNQELDLMPTQEKQKPFYPKTKVLFDWTKKNVDL
jgi:hypothetical protein